MAKKRKPHGARGGVEEGAYANRIARRMKRDDDGEGRGDDDGERADSGSLRHWWLLEDQALTDAAWGWIDRLRSRHRRQSMMDALWEAVYKDTPIGTPLDNAIGVATLRTQQSRQNIVMSMVDTLRARIGKRRPMPVISADDAGPSEKLFAKRASRVLRRKLGHPNVERMSPLCVRDGLIRGTGVAKAYRVGGDVQVERVPRRELFVDPAEAQYGTPRTMAQVKRVDRGVLLAMFPERSEDIRRAPRASRDEWRVLDETSDADLVEVGELWHLPSGCDAEDGRHAMVIRGVAPLLSCEWERPRFPFAFFQFNEAIDGFWGTGLVEHAAPIQQEVNSMLKDMGEGISQGMQLKVFLPRSSNVDKNHMRARNPVVVEHDGSVPTYVAPLPFNPAVLSYLQWRIQQAYEMAGISQASATSRNPLGSNASGKALDTMYDLESDRFSHVELQYAMFRVDLGQIILDEARDIAEDKTVEADERAPWITELDWKRIDIDSGDYHLNLEPINFLPDSRSGKLAQVKEMAEAGLLQNPMQTAALFDEPDLQRANRYLLGPYRMLERWCELLADTAVELEELMPTPLHVAYLDLAKEMAKGELAHQIADSHDPPSDEEQQVQARYRWALQMLEAEAGKAAPAAAPAMPAPMPADPAAAAMPPGAPMPPPAVDPMGGLTAQLAAGMPPPPGMVIQ